MGGGGGGGRAFRNTFITVHLRLHDVTSDVRTRQHIMSVLRVRFEKQHKIINKKRKKKSFINPFAGKLDLVLSGAGCSSHKSSSTAIFGFYIVSRTP